MNFGNCQKKQRNAATKKRPSPSVPQGGWMGEKVKKTEKFGSYKNLP